MTCHVVLMSRSWMQRICTHFNYMSSRCGAWAHLWLYLP